MIFVTACVALGFELTMGRFDHGGAPSLMEQGLALGTNVLLTPADQLWSFLGRERFGPVGQWLMLLGNAVLWGSICEAAFSYLREK